MLSIPEQQNPAFTLFQGLDLECGAPHGDELFLLLILAWGVSSCMHHVPLLANLTHGRLQRLSPASSEHLWRAEWLAHAAGAWLPAAAAAGDAFSWQLHALSLLWQAGCDTQPG